MTMALIHLLSLQLLGSLIFINSLTIVKMRTTNSLSRIDFFLSKFSPKRTTSIGLQRMKMELIPISKSQFKILMPQQVISYYILTYEHKILNFSTECDVDDR